MTERTHPASLTAEALMKQCTLKRVKRSGPGGQRRNKVETGVVLIHNPTGLRVEGSKSRSARTNEQIALKSLRLKLAIDVRSELSEEMTASELWNSRCRNEKISLNPDHEDFPAMLAEALDWVWFYKGETRDAAEKLHCTSSQILKLLRQEREVLPKLNLFRVENGLRPLT